MLPVYPPCLPAGALSMRHLHHPMVKGFAVSKAAGFQPRRLCQAQGLKGNENMCPRPVHRSRHGTINSIPSACSLKCASCEPCGNNGSIWQPSSRKENDAPLGARSLKAVIQERLQLLSLNFHQVKILSSGPGSVFSHQAADDRKQEPRGTRVPLQIDAQLDFSLQKSL